nr:MAG TPA: hypothetical protein [Caudoviricetes sp.]
MVYGLGSLHLSLQHLKQLQKTGLIIELLML